MADSAGFGGFAGERQLEALGRVASVIAHELTNLLQILASSIDRLALAHDPDDATVRTVRASLERGTRLARQLQTFAQTTPPRQQPTELHQLVAGWMTDFEAALGPEHRLELRLRHSGAAFIDAEQIETALINLLLNARDASPPNSVVTIELSRAELPTGGSGCCIAVIDHGEGMTDEVARQAVAPFFTTRAPGKGMGLGLTIARMVAEAHGGALEVDTAYGRGTTVSFYLPLHAAEQRAVPFTSSASLASRGSATPGQGAASHTLAPSHSHTHTPHVPPSHVPPSHVAGGQHAPVPSTSVRDHAPAHVAPLRLDTDSSHDSHVVTGDRVRELPPIAPHGPSTMSPASAPPASAPPASAPPAPPGHHAVADQSAPASGVRPTPFAQAGSSGCVLVVDDEEAIADYFRIILTADRFDVHVVTSAYQALDRFAADPQRYDAVLLDMMLRDGSGIDLYRKFRHLRPDLAVVVCTGFSDNDSLAPIRADGHDVLFKPCPRSDVLKAVARAVARRRGSG